MKRAVLLALAVLVAVSCKPQKPWSPYEGKPGAVDQATDKKSGAAFTKNEQFDADIGDVEQAIYISGEVTPDSRGPNIQISDKIDARKRLLVSNITVYQPVPESLWAKFEVQCSRNFMLFPAVLRAQILVNDKVAGTFSVVLGQTAIKNGISAKVDLLKPFQGQVPDSFFVKIVGDMYLMPEGTEEAKVNPDTATAPAHSQAIQATMMRVTVKRNESAPPPDPSAETPAGSPSAQPAIAPAAAATTPPATAETPAAAPAPAPATETTAAPAPVEPAGTSAPTPAAAPAPESAPAAK